MLQKILYVQGLMGPEMGGGASNQQKVCIILLNWP